MSKLTLAAAKEINEGIEKLGLELSEVMELCIKGMQEHKAELGM